MRRLYVLILLLSLCLGAFSQEITVRFTGQLNGTSYCRLESVAVTNLTRGWTETVEYPDTIIVLGASPAVGTDLNIAATQGLGQNIPNPFDCETRVELSVSQRENVRMQLLDASGKQYAEYSGSIDAGVHTFDISAAAPQTYVLSATVGSRSYSIRMVNMGSGCGSSIKYAGISGSITAKLTTYNEFQNGDNMRYVGYTTIGGQVVESEAIEQAQVVSQYVTLNFTHYLRPTIETLAATDITTTSATLRGNITDDGGAAVTSRGFYYGTDADNLSQMVSAGSGNGEYSKALSGLTVATTYYYCAFATNSAGTAIGEVMSFTLLDIVPPTVQTNAASSITATGATLNGNVTSDGGATVTARGFLYGTNSSNLTQTVQSGSGTGSFTANLTGLTSGTTYYYKAYATNSAGTAYGEVRSFTTESSGANTGTLNGHDYVDLGLPSGTLWATCNVGANTPEGYGNYYAWGETTNKETYNWDNYRYYDGSNLTKYTGSDGLTTLQSSDDAATANWGSGWRMPTQTEMQELIDNCTVTWTTQNGVNGRLFTGSNGNSIFLPAAGRRYGSELSNAGSHGFYWSSSLRTDNPNYACGLYFVSDYDFTGSYYYRIDGHSVRPVCASASSTASAPTVTTNSASSVTTTGATLNGNVTSTGGATVTARGFLYGTNSNNLSQTVQSGSGTGSFTANLTGLTSGTTYYYKAYATNSAGTAYGELMSFTTENSGATTGSLNGHDWVDLGLPSGTKWATCNVGASTPTAYGNYYAWGETTTKTTYNWSTYRHCNGSNNTLTKYCNNEEYGNNGYTDDLTTLEASDDAATANWGSGWRMPTYDEMNELINNCTVTLTTQNGVNGRLFTGPNGSSIFLPDAGWRRNSGLNDDGSYGLYWSSSLFNGNGYASDHTQAWYLRIRNGTSDGYITAYLGRDYGISVRPVCASQN